jgi:hypothetical protein
MKILVAPEVQELLQPKPVPQANLELAKLWEDALHKAEAKKKAEADAKLKEAQRVRYSYD